MNGGGLVVLMLSGSGYSGMWYSIISYRVSVELYATAIARSYVMISYFPIVIHLFIQIIFD